MRSLTTVALLLDKDGLFREELEVLQGRFLVHVGEYSPGKVCDDLVTLQGEAERGHVQGNGLGKDETSVQMRLCRSKICVLQILYV